jgi:hypothetical protein
MTAETSAATFVEACADGAWALKYCANRLRDLGPDDDQAVQDRIALMVEHARLLERWVEL